LADKSAFLDPPASELPSTAAPNTAEQERLMRAAQQFALETLPHLPDLLAMRTIFRFDDSPQEVTKGAYLERMGLHLIGSAKGEVSVRNKLGNHSIGSGPAAAEGHWGHMTWGESGPHF
jgi:hypothetical protein